jgi:hypothetical protein
LCQENAANQFIGSWTMLVEKNGTLYLVETHKSRDYLFGTRVFLFSTTLKFLLTNQGTCFVFPISSPSSGLFLYVSSLAKKNQTSRKTWAVMNLPTG